MSDRDIYYFILSIINDSIEQDIIKIHPEDKKDFVEHLADEVERFYDR
jgi:hypothetical protein